MSTADTAAASLLQLRDARFRWPRAAADCIAIDRLGVAAGQAVFMRGPSGCGKSTLLSLAAGVLVAQRGEVSLLGHDWRHLSPARRDRLRADHAGYVFQQFNLLPYLSVLDNVLLPCRFSKRRAQRAFESHSSARDAAQSGKIVRRRIIRSSVRTFNPKRGTFVPLCKYPTLTISSHPAPHTARASASRYK
jgi:predicted ABC-type transport system involved in lysophospholipase L1 biosynthesis ATPase subunit